MRSYLFFLPLGLILLACGPAPQETTTIGADRDAIDALLEEAVQAFNTGDVDAYMACFAEDAVWMLPNQPAITGKEAARTWYQDLFERTSFNVTASTDELMVAGDWAYAQRTYKGEVVQKSTGQRIAGGSNRISILHRQTNGTWKIARDIWNSSTPRPESDS